MRCTYCNWNNPDGLTRCQKCNRPLVRIESERTSAQSSIAPVESEDWKSRETRVFDSTKSEIENINSVCPDCSYPVMQEDEYCPNCGASLQKGRTPSHSATVLDASLVSKAGRSTVLDQRMRSTVLDSSFSRKTTMDTGVCEVLPEINGNASSPLLLPVEINLPAGTEIILRRGDIVIVEGQKYLLR